MPEKAWVGEHELVAALRALCSSQRPVASSKVKDAAKVAQEHVREYKLVVYSIEKFFKKARPEHRLPLVFVIDSLCKEGRHPGGSHETFAGRFGLRMKTDTLPKMYEVPRSDRPTVDRVVASWRARGLFSLSSKEGHEGGSSSGTTSHTHTHKSPHRSPVKPKSSSSRSPKKKEKSSSSAGNGHPPYIESPKRALSSPQAPAGEWDNSSPVDNFEPLESPKLMPNPEEEYDPTDTAQQYVPPSQEPAQKQNGNSEREAVRVQRQEQEDETSMYGDIDIFETTDGRPSSDMSGSDGEYGSTNSVYTHQQQQPPPQAHMQAPPAVNITQPSTSTSSWTPGGAVPQPTFTPPVAGPTIVVQGMSGGQYGQPPPGGHLLFRPPPPPPPSQPGPTVVYLRGAQPFQPHQQPWSQPQVGVIPQVGVMPGVQYQQGQQLGGMNTIVGGGMNSIVGGGMNSLNNGSVIGAGVERPAAVSSDKTVLCRSLSVGKPCLEGTKCPYAHSEMEANIAKHSLSLAQPVLPTPANSRDWSTTSSTHSQSGSIHSQSHTHAPYQPQQSVLVPSGGYQSPQGQAFPPLPGAQGYVPTSVGGVYQQQVTPQPQQPVSPAKPPLPSSNRGWWPQDPPTKPSTANTSVAPPPPAEVTTITPVVTLAQKSVTLEGLGVQASGGGAVVAADVLKKITDGNCSDESLEPDSEEDDEPIAKKQKS